MRFSLEMTFGLLAIASVEAFVVPPRSLWAASVSTSSYRSSPVRRGAGFSSLEIPAETETRRPVARAGGLMIGGLTIGGKDGGISGGGLKLGGGGAGKKNGTETAAAAASMTTVNSGGNLGITKGSDGSSSVGGSNGINVAANGKATLAGNE
ncbi:short chain dehydrogenase reductase family [Pyrenophora seminiperda CCB06]|uniref:Short chain dehydrogenase reductase family n=1 Tax=Pyrenophora seminiperda CCB06 TaxID=1302712 RepID=A0A3M7M609_9PLEO|nr:short chain dehydrogenase reductase family [Pyrenophora seminiperda CCB06]